MAIHFHCGVCGHSLQAADDLAGRSGRCKYCGEAVVVPGLAESPQAPLRLEPLERHEPARAPAHLLADHEPLTFHADAGPAAGPVGHALDVRVDERLLDTSGPETYRLHDRRRARRSSSGAPSPLVLLPSRIGRFFAHLLRRIRDWLYLISAAALTAMLIGFLFKYKVAMHLGAVVIIVANLGILVVGISYLVALPFTDGLVRGTSCLLLPPYTLYYWISHWHKMRKPVRKTLGAFLPIALVGIAYFFYEEGPAMKSAAETKLPSIAGAVENELERVDPWTDDDRQQSDAAPQGSKASPQGSEVQPRESKPPPRGAKAMH